MTDKERATVIYALQVLLEHPYLYNPINDEPLTADEIERLISNIIDKEDPRVIIVCDGGLVQQVLADHGSFIVVDYDTEGTEDEELTEVPQEDGTMEEAVVAVFSAEPLDERMSDFAEWFLYEAPTP